MAGMGDNPLVGEYTKGISKGGDYFAKLDARCKREKFDARMIVNDLEMGLMREMKKLQDQSVAVSGQGRFACVSESDRASVLHSVTLKPMGIRTVKVDGFAALKQAWGQHNRSVV